MTDVSITIDFGLRLSNGYSLLQPPDRHQEPLLALGLQAADRLRLPKIRIFPEKIETGRHDADDGGGRLVQNQRFADGVGVPVEMGFPKSIANERYGCVLST
jgi:hypothetical protein